MVNQYIYSSPNEEERSTNPITIINVNKEIIIQIDKDILYPHVLESRDKNNHCPIKDKSLFKSNKSNKNNKSIKNDVKPLELHKRRKKEKTLDYDLFLKELYLPKEIKKVRKRKEKKVYPRKPKKNGNKKGK